MVNQYFKKSKMKFKTGTWYKTHTKKEKHRYLTVGPNYVVMFHHSDAGCQFFCVMPKLGTRE